MKKSSLLGYARSRVLSSYRGKRMFHSLLCSPIITRNPLYRHLYYRDVHAKRVRLQNAPPFPIIENTNNCNVSCIFCPNAAMKRQKGFMSEQLFKSIIDQCVTCGVIDVLLQGFGEPLLDKEYVSKVRYAKKRGISRVHCVTNGILLNREAAEGLLDAGLDCINISIDAASSEVYGKIHKIPGTALPSVQFDEVVKNIDYLIALKKKMNSRAPTIEVRFKDFDVNKKELRDFIARYRKLADKVNIYMNIFNWPGSGIKNNFPNKCRLLKFPCFNLWSSLYISFNGKVALCCQDYECQIELGDLSREDMMSIWKGHKLAEFRQMHLNGQFDKILVCKDCVINTHLISPQWE